MSPESTRAGASRAATVTSEGRRVPVGQPSAQENSGGVSVDSMSGSVRSEGWEVCRREATQPSVRAGSTGKTEAATAEVGVLHSSDDLWDITTHGERREGTCVDAAKRSDGVVTAGFPGYKRQISPGSSTLTLRII